MDRDENVKRGSQKEQEHLKECRGQVTVVAGKAQRCCILSELGHEQQKTWKTVDKVEVQVYTLNPPQAIHLPLISLLQVIFADRTFQHLHRSHLEQ